MNRYYRLSILFLFVVALSIGMQWYKSIAYSTNQNLNIQRSTEKPAGNPATNRSSADGLWTTFDDTALLKQQRQGADISHPERYRTFLLNGIGLTELLQQAPMEFTPTAKNSPLMMTLPMPDGSFGRFRIEESPIMVPALADKFPQIKTYYGQGIDDATAVARFDLTPDGFHAMVLSSKDTIFIDPYTRGNNSLHVSYYKRDLPKEERGFYCQVDDANRENLRNKARRLPAKFENGATLRTFRLALAATAEYSTFHGGTVESVMSAMVRTMNRVNGIYGRDLSIRMMLIEQVTDLIYFDARQDPYTNESGSQLLSQNQTNIDSVVGDRNYDIGHVFSTGGGGVAGLGVVCFPRSKARGVTGLSRPIGDAFDVDFVAHEMGHQYGANHPFNGTSGACRGNRVGEVAYEPGSGSTIMAYAGICSTENLQLNSDDYFHTISLEEIVFFLDGDICSVQMATDNRPPIVDAGPDYTIPKLTPFTLTATASDPDGDAITYCWEEFDLGRQSPPNKDQGNRPLFRSFLPENGPSRTFPNIFDLIANTAPVGELLPKKNRTMNFRVTVRDNRSGGGINNGSMQVKINASSGPFVVTDINGSWAAGSSQMVRWNVAKTDQSPVGCTNVRILLSTDGGQSFPIVLAENTANDGNESIVVPSVNSPRCRVKVEAVGNIFFDLSNNNFTITP